MAVSSSSYFSNSIIGTPQVGADIDIQETSSSPKYPVGYGFQRADGAKFRYGHFGALTPKGYLAATDISESSGTWTSAALLSESFITPDGDAINVNYPGARRVQVLITATANQFAGAYLAVYNTGSDSAQTYRIAGNTATGNPETGYCYLDLYDPLVGYIDTTSAISIAGCRWANLETATTTDKIIGGVTVVGNSATYYGWVQTKGPAMILVDGNPVTAIGEHVTLSTNTGGACSGVVDTSSGGVFAWTQILGTCLIGASNAEYSLVDLCIE